MFDTIIAQFKSVYMPKAHMGSVVQHTLSLYEVPQTLPVGS